MLKPNAVLVITKDLGGAPRYLVETHWTGVELDRPCTGGISTGGDWKLAERLARAINAGAIHTDPKVVQDINGKTYVQSGHKVMGRYLNADLRKLGY